MLQLIMHFHDVANKKTETKSCKTFLRLLTVKYLNHEIGLKTVKPSHCQKAAIHRIPSPKTKTE